MEEKRIYCVVAETIQAPLGNIRQPIGRQAAQAAHAVSKLRHRMLRLDTEPDNLNTLELMWITKQMSNFIPITTIILQARDSKEMQHVWYNLHKRKLEPVMFSDENPEYGPGEHPTAIAVFAAPRSIRGILDYLPLLGA